MLTSFIICASAYSSISSSSFRKILTATVLPVSLCYATFTNENAPFPMVLPILKVDRICELEERDMVELAARVLLLYCCILNLLSAPPSYFDGLKGSGESTSPGSALDSFSEEEDCGSLGWNASGICSSCAAENTEEYGCGSCCC